jgi:uncharacterized protein YjiS (DUF1127 family)
MTISIFAASDRQPIAAFAPLVILRTIRNHLSYAFRLSSLIDGLFKLSDEQLKEIGLERNEIWEYAEELMQCKN